MKYFKMIVTITIALCGIILIIEHSNLFVAIGVFFMQWANNLGRS